MRIFFSNKLSTAYDDKYCLHFNVIIYLFGLVYLDRSYLLMSLPEDGENKPTEAKLQGYAAVLSIGSTRCKTNQLGKNTGHLHRALSCLFLNQNEPEGAGFWYYQSINQ